MVAGAGVAQGAGGFLDGPALDVAAGVEASAGRRGEVAVGLGGEFGAAVQDPPDVGVARGEGEFAASEPADLALGAVRREEFVDAVQAGDDPFEGRGGARARVADGEREDGAHDVFDVGDGRGHRPAAWSSALCRERV